MMKQTHTQSASMSISVLQYNFLLRYSTFNITHSGRSPIPARSAVQSNITSWQLQKLSRRALNKSIEIILYFRAKTSCPQSWLHELLGKPQTNAPNRPERCADSIGIARNLSWRGHSSWGGGTPDPWMVAVSLPSRLLGRKIEIWRNFFC